MVCKQAIGTCAVRSSLSVLDLLLRFKSGKEIKIEVVVLLGLITESQKHLYWKGITRDHLVHPPQLKQYQVE